MSIDSGRSSLLFSSAQLCPISNVSFDDHIKAHFSHPMPRPYVLTVVQVAPGMHYFTDAISLVQSKCTYEKVYCYVLRNCHAELFEPFAAVDGQLSEDFGQLLVAFSPDPSEEVDAARREVICKRSHQDGVIEELCRRVLHDHPDDCEVLSELGDLLRAKGAFDLAAHYLEQAIQKGEDSAFSLASLALVHHAKGEKVRACSLLLQAREREPENEGIGRVIEKVIQEDPLVGGILKRYECALDDYTIHLLLAELASQMGHHQEARRYLYQAIESNLRYGLPMQCMPMYCVK